MSLRSAKPKHTELADFDLLPTADGDADAAAGKELAGGRCGPFSCLSRLATIATRYCHRCNPEIPWFALDPRALALSRIMVGAVLFYTTFWSMDTWNVTAFLTEEGVWPRRAMVEVTNNHRFTLHAVLATRWWVFFLHYLLGAASVLLILGWHTHAATFVCWLLWVSEHNRCTLTHHSFSQQLAFMLLVSVLGLPWGDVWSFDALAASALHEREDMQHDRHDATKARRAERSTASIVLHLHTTLMYLLTGYHKIGQCWGDGSCVLWALRLSYITTPFGGYLLSSEVFRPVLLLAGRLTRPLEIYGAVALCSPYWTLKILAVIAFSAFHIGISLMMRLNNLPFINISILLAFIPHQFLEKLQQVMAMQTCNGLFLTFRSHATRFLLVAEDVKLSLGFGRQLLKFNHLPFDEKDASSSEAAVQRHGGGLRPGTRLKISTCSKRALKGCHIIFGGWLILWLLWDTAGVICGGPAKDPCRGMWWTMWIWMRNAGRSLMVDGHWAVFSPHPPLTDFWLVFPGQLANTTLLDVFAVTRGDLVSPLHTPLNYTQPERFSYMMRDSHWRKFFSSLMLRSEHTWTSTALTAVENEARYQRCVKDFYKFICRTWNAKYGKAPLRLLSMDVIVLSRRTDKGPGADNLQMKSLGKMACPAAGAG